MSYKKRALQGAAIVFCMSLLAALLGYFLRLFLAHTLSAVEYGLFYAVLSFVAFFILFKDLGLGSALATCIPNLQAQQRFDTIKAAILSVFSTQFLFAGLIAGLLIFFSEKIAIAFFHNSLAQIAIVFVALSYFLSTFYDVFLVSAQGFQRMFFASLTEFLRSVSVLVAVLILTFYFDGIIVPALAFFLVMLLLPFIYFFLFLRIFPSFFRVKAAFSKPLYTKLFSFGFPILIGSLGGTIIAYTDTLSLTYFRSLEEVALYQVAFPTATLLWSVSQALAFVLLPLTSELWSKGYVEELREGVNTVHTYSFASILPLGLGLIFFAPLVLSLLFPMQYAAASVDLQILAAAAICYTIYSINASILIGVGKPKVNLVITLFGAGCNLVGNLLFVPAYGLLGAAITTLVSYFLMLLVGLYSLKKHVGSFLQMKEWFLILLGGALFLGVITVLTRMLSFAPLVEAIISLCVAGGLYGVYLSFFKIVSVREIVALLRK